jgi:hypothetical protein
MRSLYLDCTSGCNPQYLDGAARRVPIRRLTPAERKASDALQLSYQRDSVALLAELLADAQGLRPLAWTVAHAGPRLTGWCLAHPESRQLDDFSAWRAFLLTRADCRPGLEQDLRLDSGEMRLAAEWQYYCGSIVTITLAASIAADLGDA